MYWCRWVLPIYLKYFLDTGIHKKEYGPWLNVENDVKVAISTCFNYCNYDVVLSNRHVWIGLFLRVHTNAMQSPHFNSSGHGGDRELLELLGGLRTQGLALLYFLCTKCLFLYMCNTHFCICKVMFTMANTLTWNSCNHSVCELSTHLSLSLCETIFACLA